VAEAAEIGAGNSAPLAFEDEPLLPGQKKRTGKLSAAERRERREEEMRIREEQERQMLEEMAAREAERAAKEAERVAKQAEKEEAERIAKEAEKAAKELDLAARREPFLKDRAAKKKADAEKAAAPICGSADCMSVESSASQFWFGRSSGTKNPCASPSRRLVRIFLMPCNAAALG
jgi:hypothetical protein